MTAAEIAKLDQWYPPCGKCAFCGHPDKRHRTWDNWISLAKSGDTAEEIAEAFDEPIEHVVAVLCIRPYQEVDE